MECCATAQLSSALRQQRFQAALSRSTPNLPLRDRRVFAVRPALRCCGGACLTRRGEVEVVSTHIHPRSASETRRHTCYVHGYKLLLRCGTRESPTQRLA